MRFGSVMYRPAPSPRERAATVSAVVLVHVGLALALLNLSGKGTLPVPDALTQLIDITAEPPPPIVTIEAETEQAKKKEGAASAKNIESEATPVVAPKPVIPVPSPNPVTASPTPREGAEATQGAADVAGPGPGRGSGTGTGSGGAGNGPGGGGNGLAVVRARLATRPLTRRDFSPEILERWPRGRPVQMGFQIDAEGRTLQCVVYIGTGDPQLDALVCATAKARLRFYPGVNRDGQRVADWRLYGKGRSTDLAKIGRTMIEAEWWDYETLDELPMRWPGCRLHRRERDGCAGSALIALPAARAIADYKKLASELAVEEGHDHPDDDRLVPLEIGEQHPRDCPDLLPTGARVFPISTGIEIQIGRRRGRCAAQDCRGRPISSGWDGEDGHTARSSPGQTRRCLECAHAAARSASCRPLPDDAPVARVT